MKANSDKPVLANLDLPEAERGYFCDARPEAVAPAKGIWENFLNWPGRTAYGFSASVPDAAPLNFGR
jgi:hypothetical protein